MKAGDKDQIEAKTRELATLAQKLGEKMYAQSGAGAQGASAGPSQAGGQSKDEGEVVDAEFEEVKDKKG